MKPRSARADERPTRGVPSEGSETRESRGSVRQGASEDHHRARVRRNDQSPASLWSRCNALDQSGKFAGTFFLRLMTVCHCGRHTDGVPNPTANGCRQNSVPRGGFPSGKRRLAASPHHSSTVHGAAWDDGRAAGREEAEAYQMKADRRAVSRLMSGRRAVCEDAPRVGRRVGHTVAGKEGTITALRSHHSPTSYPELSYRCQIPVIKDISTPTRANNSTPRV